MLGLPPVFRPAVFTQVIRARLSAGRDGEWWENEQVRVPLPLMGVWTGDIGYRRAETWVTLEQNGLIVIRRENDHALARGVGHVAEV